MRLRKLCFLASGIAIGLSALTVLAQNNDQGAARIATYNLDEGTDYKEVLGAALYDPASLPAAVQLTINNVRASNPRGRMTAVAAQIAATQPDLVGLQEATQWRSSGTCADSVTPEFDLLQLLLSDLAALGQQYAAVAVTKEFDFTGLTPAGSCVRASNRDALLARTDLAPGQFQLSNVQAVNFQNVLTFNTAIGPIRLLRGWASVDVFLRGQAFRFITTHLEDGTQGYPFDLFQHLEVGELLAGPGSTSLPVIMAADFNATANDPSDASYPAYQLLVTRFVDEWLAANPSDAGLTCCQAPLLGNTASLLFKRIDLVFGTGTFVARGAQLLGATPINTGSNVFWPSDHAGVFARVKLPDSD